MLGETIGTASALKMCFAAYTKGTTAQGNRMSYVKVRVAKGQEVWSNKRFQSLKKE
jgi:Zn finger protein HypA/HybF involved in hydrogenase expression